MEWCNPGLRERLGAFVNSIGYRPLPLGHFPEGRHFESREGLAPPGKDLGGLRRWPEIRLLRVSPWVARCRLSSRRRNSREFCPMKKAAPGTPRLRYWALSELGAGVVPVAGLWR